MSRTLKLILLFFSTSLLCSCATTVEIRTVEIEELENLNSDYGYIPGKSGWTYEGEFSGQTLSDTNRLENKNFLKVSFSSPSDLETMASELAGGGLRYRIAPCDKATEPSDSRYSGGVMKPMRATSQTRKYFVFIPKSLRNAMHLQSSGHVVAYQNYMKDAIDTDSSMNLCLYIGAIQYYSSKKFNGRLGSLEELGITLE